MDDIEFGPPSVAELKERTTYFAALKNGEAENFFGPAITPGWPRTRIPLIRYSNV